jgi:hypothetical protein
MPAIIASLYGAVIFCATELASQSFGPALSEKK